MVKFSWRLWAHRSRPSSERYVILFSLYGLASIRQRKASFYSIEQKASTYRNKTFSLLKQPISIVTKPNVFNKKEAGSNNKPASPDL